VLTGRSRFRDASTPPVTYKPYVDAILSTPTEY